MRCECQVLLVGLSFAFFCFLGLRQVKFFNCLVESKFLVLVSRRELVVVWDLVPGAED